MIRWCAYCQRYLGESEPFDDYAMTHTICPRCEAQGAFLRKEPANLGAIRRFFGRIARLGTDAGPSAADIVAEGAALGIDPVDLLLGVVQPVLYQIGDRWARSEATIADEHRITALCSEVIRLIIEGDAGAAALRQRRPPAVLLVVAEGNYHTLGVQIIEAFLLRNRVSTYTLYPGLPTEEIVSLARSLRPRVVAISAAAPEQLPSALAVAEGLAALAHGERPVAVVGGLALRGGTSVPPGAPLLSCRDLHTLVDLATRAKTTAP